MQKKDKEVIGMRDQKRIKRVLEKIEKIWNEVPDQRLFQLLSNYTQLGQPVEGQLGIIRDPFHIEDDELEKQLDYVLGLIEKEGAGVLY